MALSLSPSVQADLMELDGLDFSASHSSTTEPLHLDGGGDAESDDGQADDGEEEGVKRWLVNEAPQPRKISEKKRAAMAAWDQWIEDNQENLDKDSTKQVTNVYQSANSIVRGFENRKIITSPREYQLELFERAKERNTIAVLDTGSGKTLIAALLLRWTIQNELEARARGEPKRIAFFLVDKVALVFQQHAVLKSNLDYPVAKFCGEMLDSVVSHKDFWAQVFEDNMAVVCTAEILYSCLHHSFIRIDQINLLVFDEAHHTKKNHPYARIIKDFYSAAKDAGEKLPRLLGMTASPVDSQVDPRQAAAELEGLLHSQIATVADPALLQRTLCRPKREIVIEYGPRPRDWTTPLHQSLVLKLANNARFRKNIEYARTTAAELGCWAADRYWQLLFAPDDTMKLPAQTQTPLLGESVIGQIRDHMVGQIRDAHEMVCEHDFSTPALSKEFLSDKVIKLISVLRDQFSGGAAEICIVFVKQRTTARLLADLLQQPGIKIHGVEVGVLVGGGRTESEYHSSKVSYRDQVVTISKFKSGELKCIFATSVGEEGLDIPDCNLIVRFDLYDTLIQYIQSRGRARQAESIYVHMVEQGNLAHRRKIVQNQVNENALRKFCEAMPADRKLNGNTLNMDYFLRKETGQKQYTVPETGAKLNFKQSLVCLDRFVASLPHPPEASQSADYSVSPVAGGFQCEVTMPSNAPIRSALGGVFRSKAVAKCSAAFEMCLALVGGKYLDDHLQPIFTKQLPAMRNARLALSSKKKGEYGMRMKPNLWSRLGFPHELYATVLTLTNPGSLWHSSCPLLLLTREPVAQLPDFPLFYGTRRCSHVHCIAFPKPIAVSQETAQGLLAFTLRVFEDVFSKEYDATPDKLPYFFAPTRADHGFDFASVEELHDIVDWVTVEFVRANERVEYTFQEPDDFFQDKFVADPWDGGRKLFLRKRCYDLKPTDPVPDGIVPPRHRAWRTCKNHDILNYSVSLWSKSRARMSVRDNQPVVEAEMLPIRRNLLDDNVSDEEMEPKHCFVILEPFKISALSSNIVAMAYNLPAIIHRMEATLIALDACMLLDLHIRPDLALEAVTKDCDNSDDHSAERINFQAGMGNNYERLEFLGDSFLKMATSISIYSLRPGNDEYASHVARMLLICNRNLFNNALEVKLEEYVRSTAFNGRTWYPDGLRLKKGKKTDLTLRHTLGDKTVADVCEALIGAAYLTAQREGNLDLAVKAVTVMVKDKLHNLKAYSEYYALYTLPEWQTAPSNAFQAALAERIYQQMGYKFKYPRLVLCAFKHSTYPRELAPVPSYERLEFLGDALYDMACVDYLYHRFPGKDPQWLTEHKMAMVSNQFLGCLAISLGFHRSVMSVTVIADNIREYESRIMEAEREAKDEAVAAGKSEDDYARDFWVNCQKPPKVLADVVEAYIGAIFVDSEYDYGTVQEFFNINVLPYFENMALYDTFANNHPVTFLTNMMQTKFGCTEWRLLASEMKNVEDELGLDDSGAPRVVCGLTVHGKTVSHSVSESSRYGKMAVAKKALTQLEGMGVGEFKKEYQCDCGSAGKKLGAEVKTTPESEEVLEHGTAI
ncbi:hypothetical protein QBC37DRAFT_120683 [Rhypophila decipiens]|uniref:Dicer-like protein 1 n=1 Tax=Rhypophila decipiens TaxID=261697 RepID=A0AAN7B9E3_9PEZI|nr:hypothetical protein QBC37DRAFT_120683 [Rhypophila decipiens]